MEAEKITLADGSTASLATTHALTDKNTPSAKVVPISIKKAIVFFIGGAADQRQYYFSGPNGNINEAQKLLLNRIENTPAQSKCRTFADGYYSAKGESDIKEKFVDNIPSKNSPIYIVGHSLGGWNGAHLSRILSEKGYTVKILVTLDPVGEGFWVWLGSDIYKDQPSPTADRWINILAAPKKPDRSDGVADIGERWIIKEGPTVNKSVNRNHASAGWMFIEPVIGEKSACDLIVDSINECLEC